MRRFFLSATLASIDLLSPGAALIFRYTLRNTVSKTEFYPDPYYETVYPEDLSFSVDAPDQKRADALAADYIVNCQYEFDQRYYALLDRRSVLFRKREEIIERRPFLIISLRRSQEKIPFLSERQVKDFMQLTELPPKPEVSDVQIKQRPDSLHYRIFRNLTEHQLVYGILLLAVIVLTILFVPQFRELGAFEIIRFD